MTLVVGLNDVQLWLQSETTCSSVVQRLVTGMNGIIIQIAHYLTVFHLDVVRPLVHQTVHALSESFSNRRLPAAL